MYSETLGRNVKTRRQNLGITQDELAKMCNFSRATIYNIEHGVVNPDGLAVGTIKTLAENLCCTYGFLIGVDDEENIKKEVVKKVASALDVDLRDLCASVV